MADKLYEEITRVLRDRDIPFDRDALKSACQDPESQAAIKEWMEEFLAPETLLTKEEAALYVALTKSGDAERIAAQDLSAVHSLNESEMREAIEELKRSTAAIEKQTEALNLQQNAMSALVKNGQRSGQGRATLVDAQHSKWNSENVQVTKAIEELSQSLTYQMADLEAQNKLSEATFKQTVDHIFKSDDKLLASLQKLASDLDPINIEDIDTIARIKELCAKLIKYTVESIRTKLDHTFLEALEGARVTKSDDSQETQDLQDELESLYTEIFPVAQMSAEQQFLQPTLRTVAATSGQGQERAMKAVKYIHDCITFLVSRLEAFLGRAEEAQYHKMALQVVLDSVKKELSRVEEPITLIKSSPAKPSIQKRRRSSVHSPGTLTRNSRRRSSGMELEDVAPEQQIARNLGITLPVDVVSDHERAEALEKTLIDRLTKLNIHVTSLQLSTESSISSHIMDSRQTLQLLQDSLLAETLYHKVRLLDPDIESSVSMFEQEVENLKSELDGVDLGGLQARNVNKEQLVARWAH